MKSCRVATAYLPTHRKKAGPKFAKWPWPARWFAGVGHRHLHGSRADVGRQDVDLRGADVVDIRRLAAYVTLTSSKLVGSWPLTMDLSQVSVAVERLVPWMVIQELGTMPGWKLAPLITPF